MIRMRTPLLVTLLACSAATAEPAWKNELSTATLGPHARLGAGTLNFKVSWNGMIDSGKLSIQFAPKDVTKPKTYIVTSSAASTGAAAGLFPYQSSFWSELDPATFKPRLFYAEETDRNEKTTTTTRFTPTKVTCKETSQPLPKGTAKTKERTFRSSPVFDIFSAMLYIRSQPLADGDSLKLVIQPFKTPYLLSVKVVAHEKHQKRDTIRLSVGMRKIDTKTLKLRSYTKMKNDATLWLSNDKDRVPVEFRAAIFIGDIRATLTSYQKY